MAIQLKFKVGNIEVAVNGKEEKEAIRNAAFWSQLPCECGACASKNIGFKFSSPQGYEYYSLICKDCAHEFKFGIRQSDHGLFPKADDNGANGWTPPFSGQQQQAAPPQRQQAPPQRPAQRPPQRAPMPMPEPDDDIPF